MTGVTRGWRQSAVVLFPLIFAAVLLAGCGAAAGDAPPPPAPAATREPAHDFSLKSLDGATVALSTYKGKWVLLNFWATWCPPCIKEMPYLNELAASRDLVVLGVNFNEDAATARRYVEENAITFPILLEPDDITLLMYQVRGLPRSFLIAPDGAIARTIVGQINPEQLNAWLDAEGVK